MPKAWLGSFWDQHHNFQSSLNQSTQVQSTYGTFLESLGQDLSNPAYIGLISGAILTPHP